MVNLNPDHAVGQVLTFLKTEMHTENWENLKNEEFRLSLIALIRKCPLGLYPVEIWNVVFQLLEWGVEFADYTELQNWLERENRDSIRTRGLSDSEE